MSIINIIKEYINGGSLKIASDIVAAVSQIISYYDANACDPSNVTKRDAFLDALIKLLQDEKSKQA